MHKKTISIHQFYSFHPCVFSSRILFIFQSFSNSRALQDKKISSRVILYYMRYNTQFNTCAFMRMNHRHHHPWDILMRVRGKVYDESTYLSTILPQNYLWYKDRLPVSFRSHRHIHPNAHTHTHRTILIWGWISRFNNNTLAVNLFYIHIWYM